LQSSAIAEIKCILQKFLELLFSKMP